MFDNKQEDFLFHYDAIKEQLERYVLNLTRNRNDAKDIISETILIAYQNFEQIENKVALLSYLFTISRRLFYQEKYKKKRIDYSSTEFIDELISDDISQEDKMDIQILYKAIDELEENQRETIILAEIMGFAHKEIAKIQDTTVANIKIRIFRAKKALKIKLKIEEEKRTKVENLNYIRASI
ncbi:MAG: sigma-70 family RNA polymerase sigma factor [Candidatus Kapabacteria bacterium]|nr:sigma-70 family RNA polymerase sigma factor [Candidatus Kapabacteria bacterium]